VAERSLQIHLTDVVPSGSFYSAFSHVFEPHVPSTCKEMHLTYTSYLSIVYRILVELLVVLEQFKVLLEVELPV